MLAQTKLLLSTQSRGLGRTCTSLLADPTMALLLWEVPSEGCSCPAPAPLGWAGWLVISKSLPNVHPHLSLAVFGLPSYPQGNLALIFAFSRPKDLVLHNHVSLSMYFVKN